MAKSKAKPKAPATGDTFKLPPDVLELERDDRVSFRCPPVLRQAIEAHARKDHRTVSDWLVIAVNTYINEKDY